VSNFDNQVLFEVLSYAIFTVVLINFGIKIILDKRRQKDKVSMDSQIDKIADLMSTYKLELDEAYLTPVEKVEKTVDHNKDIQNLRTEMERLKFEIVNRKNTWTLFEGLIEDYHKQALRQASVQFWFSAFAAIVGLGFIITSLFFSVSTNVYEKVVGTLPGVTIDVLAVLFFKQAEQTRQRATELYDRLRLDKERDEAIKLIESIDDPKLKSMVKAQLALKIGGVDVTLIDLATVSSESNRNN